MAVEQVLMEMSAEAALGIASGEMVRHGGVVYRATGGIFEHLADAAVSTVAKETPISVAQAPASAISKVAKHLKNPKVLIAIGLGAVVASGLIYYVKDKNRKKAKQAITVEMPKCIADYNDSVVAYLEAIDSRNVSLDKINCVIKNIDILRENKEIAIDFEQGKSETLIVYVYDYTKKLAEANSFKFIDFEKATPITIDNTLICLHQYLEIQKNILEKAA